MNKVDADSDWWALWSSDSYGNLHVVEAGLTFQEALESRDEKYGGRGIASPGRYATQVGNVLEAASIANEYLDGKILELYSDLSFGATVVRTGTPMYWFFSRECDEWLKHDKTPARLGCAVDKVDTSIWTEKRQEQFMAMQRPDW